MSKPRKTVKRKQQRKEHSKNRYIMNKKANKKPLKKKKEKKYTGQRLMKPQSESECLVLTSIIINTL